MLCYIIFYALYYIISHYIILNYIILYYAMLCYAILCYIIFYYIILCYVMLCFAVLCCIVLYYIILLKSYGTTDVYVVRRLPKSRYASNDCSYSLSTLSLDAEYPGPQCRLLHHE